MSRPIPQPARAFLAGQRLKERLGLAPDPVAAALQPHAERLARTLPRWITGRPDNGIQTTDVTVAGRGGPVPVRLYRPPDSGQHPAGILFIHGGAFSNFGLSVADTFQRQLARLTGAVVVGLSYRLAPEHPFPAGLEDCRDVLGWMSTSAPLGMDAARLAVAGESSGGNFAIALAMLCRDTSGPGIAHLTAICPFADTTLTSTDWDTVRLPGASRAGAQLMVEAYAGENRDHPLVNVAHSDLTGLPSTFVVTCEHDPVRSDGFLLAQRLGDAAVPTRHVHLDNMPHGFLLMPGLLRQVPAIIAEIAAEIRRGLHAHTDTR